MNKYWKNNKTGKVYEYVDEIIDATNDREGQHLIIYSDNEYKYGRESKEFLKKFTPMEEI